MRVAVDESLQEQWMVIMDKTPTGPLRYHGIGYDANNLVATGVIFGIIPRGLDPRVVSSSDGQCRNAITVQIPDMQMPDRMSWYRLTVTRVEDSGDDFDG